MESHFVYIQNDSAVDKSETAMASTSNPVKSATRIVGKQWYLSALIMFQWHSVTKVWSVTTTTS